ncbi:MAG: hypothetical protein HWE39_12885 [Oceanospirillaceae bacterium]|nr:hypothetical protein [Oceanospirillaceae bacterium]
MGDSTVVMDYPALRFWWDVLQTAILVAISIYVWIKGRSQINTDRIDKLEKTLIEHDKRLSQAIGHGDLEGIHSRLGGISRDLANLEGESKANSELLGRIDSYIRTIGAKQ